MPFKPLIPALSVSPQLSKADVTQAARDDFRLIIDGTKPQRLSWLLKYEALPWIYWNAMLKDREWMAQPHQRDAA